MTTTSLTLAEVEAAAQRLRGEVVDTPCLHSRTLSAIAGCEVALKFENHQFTASFKERGALNKMAQLSAAERDSGVLAVSAVYLPSAFTRPKSSGTSLGPSSWLASAATSTR